jgi:hypothetical protein
MKIILKVFVVLLIFLVNMRVFSWAFLLADYSSDYAVLGAVGVLLLTVLIDLELVRMLFFKTKKEKKVEKSE